MPTINCGQPCPNPTPVFFVPTNTGSSLTSNTLTYNSVSGLLSSVVNGVIANTTVTLPASASVQYQNEGLVTGSPSPTTINFVGANVNATQVGSVVTVTVTGGGSGGAQTPITANNSNTLNLTASGLDNHTLAGAVRVSLAAGNAISTNLDGLFVAPAAAGVQTPITAVDSSSIDLTASGLNNHTLTAVARISLAAGNVLGNNLDGLFVAAAAAGVQTPITVTDTATIDLTASGPDNHSLTASLNLSAAAGNAALANLDGLFVPTAVNTPLTANDSPTIDFTTSGLDSHTFTGAVRISAQTGNILTPQTDGLSAVITTGNLLGDNTSTVATGTARLIGGNATVTVPMRINTSTVVTTPSTAGGYIINSNGNSVVVTNPTAGVINLEVPRGFTIDTLSTGNVIAVAGTINQSILFATPFSTNRTVTLSSTGATNGAVIEISTVNPAGTNILPLTTQINVVNGFTSTALDTITDVDVYARYMSNGTTWARIA